MGGWGRSHQQLLRDQLHDQLLWPLVRLPVGGEGQGGPGGPGCPAAGPPPHGDSQVLPLVHVGLAGEGPLQLCVGVRVGSALLWQERESQLRRPGLSPTVRADRQESVGTPTQGTRQGPTRTLTSCHSRTPLQASSLLLSRCSPTARPPRASPGEQGPMGPKAPNTRAPGYRRGRDH